MKKIDRKIILASTSPRRIQIMGLTSLKFTVDPGGYEEDMTLDMPPHRLVAFLARGKARATAHRHQDAIVIGGDTFIVFQNKNIGKPKSPEDARRTLRLLSGKTHLVISALAVIDTRTGKEFSALSEIKVTFRKISPREIAAYVRSGEPMDKAASYAIQGIGGAFVKKIEGDYSGLLGLSLLELGKIFKKLGIEIL